jgi:nicotinate-nucleotide pyrophosphorylase (carboxylating)
MNPVFDFSHIAATGVDRISVGALTKDVKAVDFSMRLSAVPV